MAVRSPRSEVTHSAWAVADEKKRLRLIISALCLVVFFEVDVTADTIRVPQDHPTIQEAIDAASAGDTVMVDSGVYHERLQIRNGVSVRSAGDDTKGKSGLKRAVRTIIDGGGKDGIGAGVLMGEGCVLDGFTVTNVGLYDDALWEKHHATQGNQQSHEHIGAPGTPGIGIVGVNCLVRNNIVHHIGYTGIAIQGVDGKRCQPQVTNNICYRNMGGGIGSMSRSAALIEGNVCFQNFYAGIGHEDASPTVLNNDCYENIRAGIGVSEGACPIVRGNRCYQNRRAGIGVRTEATTRPLIEDNDCYENDMAGIGAEEESSPLIRGNRCFRNKLAGIGVRSHAAPTMVDNICHENDEAGIGQAGDAVTILIGNQCHHNKKSGIGFADCSAGRSVVTRNNVFDNAMVAIGIHSGWVVTLSENKLSRTGGMPPLVMVFAGAEATLTDNVMVGGGVAGVRVAGTVHLVNNELVGTSLRKGGPPNFAVWGLPGSDITMTGNTARHWRHALQATESTVQASKNNVEEFFGAAFVVRKAPNSVSIFGNTAVSANPDAKVVLLTDSKGMLRDNVVMAPDTTKAGSR